MVVQLEVGTVLGAGSVSWSESRSEAGSATAAVEVGSVAEVELALEDLEFESVVEAVEAVEVLESDHSAKVSGSNCPA